MARFRDIDTSQKFASAHASIHDHRNQDRHINRRNKFKQSHATALAEWRQHAAPDLWVTGVFGPVLVCLIVPAVALIRETVKRDANALGVRLKWDGAVKHRGREEH